MIIDAGGIEEIVLGHTAAGVPPLKRLYLEGTKIGDRGVKALAAAPLTESRLGSRLKELYLGRCGIGQNCIGFTDKGSLALFTAIMQGPQRVACLEMLSLYAPSISVECATALVVVSCRASQL